VSPASTAIPGAPFLSLEGIRKAYPGVLALDAVDLEVVAGEVHMLLGENGAGKSTLVKVISGAIQPDAGQITIGGRHETIRSPLHARQLGIATIYQEFDLIPSLSVAENIYLGWAPLAHPFPFIDWRRLRSDAEGMLENLGMGGISPRERVGDLGVAQQQMVEIAKALAQDARLIVMDEPTAALTEREANELFVIMTGLSQRGVTFLFVSHRLEEAKRIGDRATVLRNGRRIATIRIAAEPVAGLIRMMVGRDIADLFPYVRRPLGETLLDVRGLTRAGYFEDASLTVRGGEVVGIAGLVGAGRTSLVRSIAGADHYETGEIRVLGQTVPRGATPNLMLDRGVALLPENRKQQGLVLVLSVAKNITLASLNRLSRAGFVNGRRETAAARSYVTQLDIKASSLDAPVRNLSGGNQQKVVLSKYLCRGSRVLIFDEPTRGVDIGAKVEIYRIIDALKEAGHGILLVSSDLPEVMSISDRIVVMSAGRVTGEFDHVSATQEAILERAFANLGAETEAGDLPRDRVPGDGDEGTVTAPASEA
jgi:ribose transport system ATP-binding protein